MLISVEGMRLLECCEGHGVRKLAMDAATRDKDVQFPHDIPLPPYRASRHITDAVRGCTLISSELIHQR